MELVDALSIHEDLQAQADLLMESIRRIRSTASDARLLGYDTTKFAEADATLMRLLRERVEMIKELGLRHIVAADFEN